MNPVSDLGAVGYILFWGLTALAAGVFLFRGYQLFRLISLGRRSEKFGHLVKRAFTALGHVIIQKCQFKNITRKDRGGVSHLFIAWGFLFFVTYYFFFIIIASGFGISDVMEKTKIYGYYTWVMDFVAPFIVIGTLWAIIRRYIVKPARLKGQQTAEALIILITVLIHPITHVGKIATQIAAGHPPAGLGILTPPLSTAVSQLYTNAATIAKWHSFWFWSHWVFVLVVLGMIAYTRYLHIIAGALNDLLRRTPPKGTPERIDLNDPSSFGVDRVDNFAWKQLLDSVSCVVCGYCQEICPAAITGKKLNPRLVIRDIKTNMLKNGPFITKKQAPVLPLIGDDQEGSVPEEAIWACTTCGGCMEVCPVYIEHAWEIIDMRRHLVQMQAKFPDELLNLFENTEQRSNPWGIAPADRAKWASGIETKPFEAGKTEYLFYVGCAGAFDARNRHISLAIARILDAAGISWGILGKDELCCGDSLRRLGNEYVFDRIAKNNVKMFQDRGVKKIITECPHCFHTLKNDYHQYGADWEVIHHAEFIRGLIKEKRLKLNGNGDLGKVLIHDSCYLGRHNGIYEAPREVLAQAIHHAPTEMKRSLNRSFCCGAGGGHMWMEENVGKRINHERVEEALKEDPRTICVCCPYCMTMFEDGIKDLKAGEKVQVLDLAEIVAQALQ